jgi:hypothetical protein
MKIISKLYKEWRLYSYIYREHISPLSDSSNIKDALLSFFRIRKVSSKELDLFAHELGIERKVKFTFPIILIKIKESNKELRKRIASSLEDTTDYFS